MKLLIIDDSRAIHAFLKQQLTHPEVELVHCYNGKEGSDLVLSKTQSFDLVFLDWEMPIQDGPTTLRTLRAHGIQIPILMMTTKNAPEEIFEMLKAGANEYMLKPFTKDILFEKIEQAAGFEVPHAA